MGRKVKVAFIGGTGRCGTSITRQLLGCSSEIGVLPFEHRILIDPDGPIEFYDRMRNYRDPYSVDIAINRLIRHLERLDEPSVIKKAIDGLINKTDLSKYFSPSKYSGWELSKTFCNYQFELRKFKSTLKSFTYKGSWVGTESYILNSHISYISSNERKDFNTALHNFYMSLVNCFLERNSKSYFIEDSTWNMSHIRSLSEIFPEAKFVHVYRDPRDVIASFISQKWMPNKIDQVVKIYQDLMSDILSKTTSNLNCYSLKFERLIENKDAELTKLCTYLGIDYTDAMQHFELRRANIGRFKKDFDVKTIEFLNNLLLPQLEALGYA
jgi:hypothetical protein